MSYTPPFLATHIFSIQESVWSSVSH